MNVDITLSGPNKDRATLKWALMSRAAAYKLTDGGSLAQTSFLGSMQKIGFKRVTFSGILDESWSYDREMAPDRLSAPGFAMIGSLDSQWTIWL